MITRIALSKYV